MPVRASVFVRFVKGYLIITNVFQRIYKFLNVYLTRGLIKKLANSTPFRDGGINPKHGLFGFSETPSVCGDLKVFLKLRLLVIVISLFSTLRKILIHLSIGISFVDKLTSPRPFPIDKIGSALLFIQIETIF